jgi:predicted phage-related endonuclease
MHDFSPEARNSAVWSTEAAAACGVSERTTQAELWARKMGMADEADISDALPVRLGQVCEPGVVQLHIEDTGHDVQRLHRIEHFTEVAGFPMGSHYDALNKTTNMLHEVKFFGMARLKEFGAPGSDNVPMDILVQVLHEMAVWNACAPDRRVNGVEVDVVFGNVQRAVFVVPYDQGAIDMMYKREAEFWALCQTQTPPPPQSIDDCRRVFAATDGSVREASHEAMAAYEALISVRKQQGALEAQEAALKKWLMEYMGAAAVLEAGGRKLCTWNATKPPERIDGKLLRAQYPEIAAAVTKTGAAGRQFLVKD